MENKKRALGRGLEELFNNEMLDINKFEEQVINEAKESDIVELDLELLRKNPYQPRQKFDQAALEELASSIKEYGVFQPIIVRESIKGYEIIAGERRVRASKLAGKKTIPAIIREFDDNLMMEIALLENLQRENLSAIEEATAYASMLDKLNLTQEELAKKVGKSRSHITNMLGLLKLSKEVQNMVMYNKLSMGHARVLSKLEDQKQAEQLALKVVNENLSVRDLETLTSTEQYQKHVPNIRKRETNNDYKYVEQIMIQKLDTKVKIKEKKMEISFSSKADLTRILEILDINIKE